MTARVDINETECVAAGLDPKKIAAIARRIERAAQDARKLGLHIFGGTGTGSLRFDDGGKSPLIVATMAGWWSGGCGAEHIDPDGLIRGEP